jgi:hypothetical protein
MELPLYYASLSFGEFLREYLTKRIAVDRRLLKFALHQATSKHPKTDGIAKNLG